MKIEMQNYNWVLRWRDPRDWIAWVSSPIINKNRNPSMNWTQYAPEHEIQLISSWLSVYETMFCVSFSATDGIETESNYLMSSWEVPTEYIQRLNKAWYFKNWKINFSDRFVWILWETTKDWAYLFKIASAIRKYWLIPETMLPLNAKSYDEFVDRTKITDEMYKMWEEFNKMFTINFEWIDYSDWPIWKETLKNALKFSPLQAVVRYDDWNWILNPSWNLNHAIMINWYDESNDALMVNDSYSTEQKLYSREHPRSYLQYSITVNKPINMDIQKFLEKNDQKWVRNINNWAFWKVLRWKLYVANSTDRMLMLLVDEAHRKNWVSITDVEWQLLPKELF